MPTLELHLIEGYDAPTKQRIGETLTDALRSIVPAPPEGTIVIIHEHKPGAYMRGRVARDPAPALPDPVEVVRAFLAAMEQRDLAAAQQFLAEGFTMTFPGNAVMHRLQELIDWARPRYTRVAKTYERFDTALSQTGSTVYCFGTLHGEWLDGTAFEGIRFVDRFEVAGGKLTRQDVWNDLSEARLGRDMGEVRGRG